MFLANENFPRPSIHFLRENGYLVKSIQEDSPGIPDNEVITIAQNNNLIILTFDKDYGELIFRHSRSTPPSIIFFREKGDNPLFAGQLLLSLLSNSSITLEKAFTVIEEKSLRQRFY